MVPLCGKPLVWWTIEAAHKSCLDEVIISTDCEYVAGFHHGLGTPIRLELRPAELAQDDTPTIDVLKWHVNQQDVKPDAVMCLQPTCPLRRPEDIDGAIEMMERYQCDSVVSYVSVGANHPARMARIAGANRVLPIDTNDTFKRRQDLDEMFIRSGDIYLTKTDVLLGGSMTGKDQRAWIIDPARWVNIDTRMDLLLAEVVMKDLQAC